MLDIDDIGIDISIYGPFFRDIPGRLGTNEALDSAASAFIAAFPYVRTRQLTTETYQTCNYALGKLRGCLNDPEQALRPETLCAVYMIMIFQVCLDLKSRDESC
jgi:hypothetical protein